MKISDVRALSPDQINDEVLKLKKEEFNLRFQRATGQLEKPSRFREIRRTIARLLTVANEQVDGRTPRSAAPKKAKAQRTQASADAGAEQGTKSKAKAEKPAKAKAEKTETKSAKKPAAKKKAED